jgi:hypothetical protein
MARFVSLTNFKSAKRTHAEMPTAESGVPSRPW